VTSGRVRIAAAIHPSTVTQRSAIFSTSPGRALSSEQIGILLFFCGLSTFAIFDATSKYLVQIYPALFVNWVRYCIVALVGLLSILRYGNVLPSSRRLRVLLGLRGLALAFVGICFMLALQTMPLGAATAILFTSPLIVLLLSPWVLGERLGRAKWLAVIVGFSGMLLIVRPGGHLPLAGTMLMLIAAISFAGFQLLTRLLARDVPNHIQYAYTSFMCVLVAAIPAPFFLPEVWPSAAHVVLIIGLSLANAAGQLLLIAAFRRVAASTLAPLNYFQLLMAVLIGLIWFHEMPDGPALGGMALIMLAGLFLARGRAAQVPAAPLNETEE